jgi:hypothetical protein
MKLDFTFHEREQMSIIAEGIDESYSQEYIEADECKVFKLLNVDKSNVTKLAVALSIYDDYTSELGFACNNKGEAREAARKVKEQRREIKKIIKSFAPKIDCNFDEICSDLIGYV